MTSENMMQEVEEKPIRKKYIKDKDPSADTLDTLNKDQQAWYSFATDMLDRAYNMMTFLYIDQWDGDVRSSRAVSGKPTMTFNMLVPIIRAILGEARKNSPENKVVGAGENANNDAAELRTGILRRIAYESDSPMVYQTALKQAVEVGWGAAQVDICYKKGTFKKYIELIPCVDYQSCYWDPAAQQPDRSDGDYCGNHWTMARDDYDRMYGDEYPDPVSVTNNLYTGNEEERDVVIGCNTWKKKYYSVTLCKLSDGTECTKQQADELIAARDAEIEAAIAQFAEVEKDMKKAVKKGLLLEPLVISEDLPEPLEIVDKRTELDFDLIKYRWVNNYILEEEVWPGKMLPIVYFEGDSTVLRGDRIPLSFVQDGVDPQKLINYYGSEVALSVLNSRREQWLVTKQMIQGVEGTWKNQQNLQAFLTYTPDPMAQGSGGKPEYIAPNPFHEGLLAAMQSSIIQLKQVLGRPDEMQGMESNAISGVAISRRQQAGNNAVNVYIDNWERGIKQCGKVQLELLKYVYDDEQMIQVREADGIMKMVGVNKPTGNFMYDNNGEPAQEIIDNDLSAGEYDVEVQVAGTYDQQQLEKINTFKEFIGLLAQVSPQSPQAIIDLVPKMIGLENAVEIEKRLIATAPPQMQAIIEGKDPKELPPPPPDPMMMAEMKKAEAEGKKADIAMAEVKIKEQEIMSNLQVKQAQLQVDEQKIANSRLEMILNAQIAGVNADQAIKKAQAGVVSSKIKAQAELDKAHIQRGTEHLKHSTETIKHHTQRMGHVAKLAQQAKQAKSKQQTTGEQ